MHYRIQLGKFLNEHGLTGAGVEVGVRRGDFAKAVLDEWRGERLYLVDPWQHQSDDEYHDNSNVGQAEQNANLEAALPSLEPHRGRYEVVRAFIKEAAERFADASLDFIYIDGNHRYEAIREDLRSWYRKLRPGGLFAGHDYLDGERGGSDFGVQSAVDEFALEHGLDLRVTHESWPSWFCFKKTLSLPTDQNICIVTAFDAHQNDVGAISVPNKQQYCRRHGYALSVNVNKFDPERPAAWSKIRFIRDQLQPHDWIFWNDADTLIMNPAITLERFIDAGFDLIIGKEDQDIGGSVINCGAFFLRRSTWSFTLLDRIYDQVQYLHHRLWENGALLHLLAHEDMSSHVKIVPQSQFNAFPSTYRTGNFLLHFPGMEVAGRCRAMHRFDPRREEQHIGQRIRPILRGQKASNEEVLQ